MRPWLLRGVNITGDCFYSHCNQRIANNPTALAGHQSIVLFDFHTGRIVGKRTECNVNAGEDDFYKIFPLAGEP